MIVVDGAHQLVEECAIDIVLDLNLVKGGDLLLELWISLVDALDDGWESPRGVGEGEDANEHHKYAEAFLCHADRRDVTVTNCEDRRDNEVHWWNIDF